MSVTEQPLTTQRASGALFWAALLWATVGVAFLILAVFAWFYDYFPSDVFIARRIQNIDVPAFGGYVDFVNLVGNGWVLIALALIGAAGLAAARAPAEATLLLLAIGPRLVNSVLKGVIQRPRPSQELVDVSGHATNYSFPSGHAVGTSVLLGALFLIIPAVVPMRPLRWLLQTACLLLIVSAGAARVYVGVHWPSDVLGGYLLALMFLIPAIDAYRAIKGNQMRKRAESRMID